ncbi:MAG: hypothetical protein JO316_26465 [Abitibacteriaceae bacterium]|nr:hypothetical protein [Abditibacteriaceae bacterium]MBV9868905.1 hypothetical protein [Abditibacteriaceae bacterium]
MVFLTALVFWLLGGYIGYKLDRHVDYQEMQRLRQVSQRHIGYACIGLGGFLLIDTYFQPDPHHPSVWFYTVGLLALLGGIKGLRGE